MTKPLNTTTEFEFCDGTKVKMTLTFWILLQLKSKRPDLYARYNKIMTANSKGTSDELDTITLLYIAYVCANLNEENLLSEEKFIIMCGCDREEVSRAAMALTQPKKLKALESRSQNEQKQENRE